jgi:hypothetical protein
MITITKTTTGGYTVSAMITDGLHAWLEWQTYYGHTKRDAAKMFRQHLADKRLKVSR